MSGGMGEGIFGDPPGSFGAMSQYDKMIFESDIRQARERRLEQEQKAAESVVSKTVEIEGEQNG